MKKYLIYIILVAGGVLLGYVIFNNSSDIKNISEEAHNENETQMWTCSMHPQILKEEPGDCPICGMELIPVESGNKGLRSNEFSMTENAMQLANIQTSMVGENGAVNGKLNLSGKIEVNDDKNATMPAHFNGRVEKLYVNTVGDNVKMGQTIASVYSPDLVAAQQELITAAKLKSSQPQLYKAVRNKFSNWKISGELLDEIENTGNVRASWPIDSHVNGTVTEIMVEEGAHIMDGMPILKVANLNSVWAVFDAYESQISNLKEGQELKISVNAFPNKEFSGKISFINPVLNNSSRTVEVRVVMDNKNSLLKPGMFVKASVDAGEGFTNKSLEIPKSAVMWTGERSLVYVKTSETEPVFEMREVKLGNSNGETYQVVDGLREGEEIVTNGTFTIDAAAQLQGKNSMMNKNAETGFENRMELSESFEAEFKQVLNIYFELKDELVASDAAKTGEIASELWNKTKNLDTSGSAEMLTAHLKKMNEMLKAISETKDINKQRDHFRILSQQMIAIAKNVKNLDEIIYVQHCPMASNNNGADWLSQSSEIKNPYYGAAMLGCGEVTEEIK